MNKKIIWLSILFIVLNVIDTVTTFIGISNGLQEGNFFIKFIVENHFSMFVGLKIMVVCAIVYVYNMYYCTFTKLKSGVLGLLNFVYVGVITNNLMWWFS